MVGRRSFLFKSVLGLLLLAVVAFLARDVWLGALGTILVHDDGAGKADIAVVLAGDYWGHRLFKGGGTGQAGLRAVGPGQRTARLLRGQ